SLPVCTHRAKKAFLASLTALSSWLGIGTLIASAALMYWQSLDFVTVLAMVAPFVGLAPPSIPRRGKEPPPQPFSSTIFGTTPIPGVGSANISVIAFMTAARLSIVLSNMMRNPEQRAQPEITR